ncbi:hypothetical protein AW902_19555 [Pseudomonas aeruginosa]|nr:hypothetical protein AW902_19555 [Pseudomonas aeruginosa]KXD25223.1 hypothetical protein AW903_19735 [Pseudomonas aeruginosa]
MLGDGHKRFINYGAARGRRERRDVIETVVVDVPPGTPNHLRPLRLCLLRLQCFSGRFVERFRMLGEVERVEVRRRGGLRQGGAGLLRGYEPAGAVAFAADLSDTTVA